MPKKQDTKKQSVTADQIEKRNVDREFVSADKYLSVYANDTQVQISPWDFRILFGVIASLPTVDNQTVRIKQVGEVHMSPQHAKRVAQVLLLQLQNYEKNFGAIPQPPE